MRKINKLTVTLLTLITIFCVTTVSAEVVFEDTFENVPDGSGVNTDIDAAGRQSGTIAPTNYGVTSIATINGGILEQVGDPVGKYVSPNYNFTDLNENFVVECDVQKDNGWLGFVVGSSTEAATDGDRINFWIEAQQLYLFEDNVQDFNKVIPTANVDMSSNMHVEIVVANASYGGSDNPRISLFVNGNAQTIYDMGAGYWGYSRKSPITYAQNYINFISYITTSTSYWDNLKIRNSDVILATSQWLTDSDLDLDNSRNYTHAVNFNANANVTINGVTFDGSPTNQESGINWELHDDVNTTPDSDWVNAANNADTQITGAGTNLINGYVRPRWNNGGYLKLTGLPTGNIGTFEMYSIAKLRSTLPNDRSNYFATSVGGQYEADQNLYDEGTGMVQKVEYTVPESGSITIAITPLVNSGGQTVRWYAFSNWIVPEPGIISLLALAGMAFLRRK